MESSNMCQKHPDQMKRFYCPQCMVTFCLDCFDEEVHLGHYKTTRPPRYDPSKHKIGGPSNNPPKAAPSIENEGSQTSGNSKKLEDTEMFEKSLHSSATLKIKKEQTPEMELMEHLRAISQNYVIEYKDTDKLVEQISKSEQTLLLYKAEIENRFTDYSTSFKSAKEELSRLAPEFLEIWATTYSKIDEEIQNYSKNNDPKIEMKVKELFAEAKKTHFELESKLPFKNKVPVVSSSKLELLGGSSTSDQTALLRIGTPTRDASEVIVRDIKNNVYAKTKAFFSNMTSGYQCVVVDQSLYIIGGEVRVNQSNEEFSSLIRVYDIYSIDLRESYNMAYARCGHSIAAYKNIVGKNEIFIAGCFYSKPIAETCEIYDIDKSQCDKISPMMNCARSLFGLCYFEGQSKSYMYAFGGNAVGSGEQKLPIERIEVGYIMESFWEEILIGDSFLLCGYCNPVRAKQFTEKEILVFGGWKCKILVYNTEAKSMETITDDYHTEEEYVPSFSAQSALFEGDVYAVDQKKELFYKFNGKQRFFGLVESKKVPELPKLPALEKKQGPKFNDTPI